MVVGPLLELTKHRAAILEAKDDYLRTKKAISDWRQKKDLNNLFNVRKSNVRSKSSNSCSNNVPPKTFNNNRKNLRLLQPLQQPRLQDVPPKNEPRKCSSEVLFETYKPTTVKREDGITLGDIFNEVTSYSQKAPEKESAITSIVDMMSKLNPERSKHFTTPAVSKPGSPPCVHRQISPIPRTPTPPPLPQKVSCVSSLSEEDLDLIQDQSFPYAHRRCGTIEVLPTITETPTRSVSANSSIRSLASTPLVNYGRTSTSQMREVNRSAAMFYNESPRLESEGCRQISQPSPVSMSRCSLCERYGMSENLIFSVDNLRYNPVNKNRSLGPYSKADSHTNHLPPLRHSTPVTPVQNAIRKHKERSLSNITRSPANLSENGNAKNTSTITGSYEKYKSKVYKKRMQVETTMIQLGSPKFVSYGVDEYEPMYTPPLHYTDYNTLPSLPPLPRRIPETAHIKSLLARRSREIDDSGGVLCGKKTNITPSPYKKKVKKSTLVEKKSSDLIARQIQGTSFLRSTPSREIHLHIKLPSVYPQTPEPIITKKKKKRKKSN